MVDLVDSQPLTDFLQNADRHVARLKDSGEPEVLTIDGRAELVVQSADAYRKLLDLVDEADSVRVLRQRIAVADLGQTGVPLDEAFKTVRRNLGFAERPR